MDALSDLSEESCTTLPERTSMGKDFFLLHYKKFLVRDLAGGRPAEDTVRTYVSNIDLFINWASQKYPQHHILDLTEMHITDFRDYLYGMSFKIRTIALKLTALRRFYQCAVHYKLSEENPVKYVKPGKDPNAELPNVKYLTAGQLEYLLRSVPLRDDDDKLIEEHLRDLLIMMMMAIEGLRTVEVKRMSVGDIDWEQSMILIHGKGHNDYIYPREDIMTMLKTYLEMKRSMIMADKYGIPVFTVVNNNNQFARLSRQSIRKAVDYWLTQAKFKKNGDGRRRSCHLLRHTCGTLLYAETKDLQVVKNTLRHSDLKMASKYAHLQDRMMNRYTRAIPVRIDWED